MTGTTGLVIVGIDGSPGSKLALDWAADKADSLGTIKPVATYHIDALGDGVGTPSLYEELTTILREDAEERLVETLKPDHPELVDRAEVVRGYPGPSLVRAAEGQRLLVVGSRGRSALAETLLGSVTSYCVKHATVPVAVIPDGTPADQPLDHLLVGVDGSDNAARALRWAVDHVSPDGRITAIGCWSAAPYALELIPPIPRVDADTRAAVEATIDRVIEDVETERPGAGATLRDRIEVKVVMGDARTTLRSAAANADLLVIGARGHRGASYLLLGSVTTSLVHHPTVATVVVPG